jgi:hypothetical protein
MQSGAHVLAPRVSYRLLDTPIRRKRESRSGIHGARSIALRRLLANRGFPELSGIFTETIHKEPIRDFVLSSNRSLCHLQWCANRSPGGAGAWSGYVKLGPYRGCRVTIWTSKLDMSTIPDEVLFAEFGRRRVSKRAEGVGGRPKTLHRCPHCKGEFGARELRAHKPRCPKR